MRTILVPFGTRPEIVKLAPVIATLAERGFRVHRVATGQHDDPALSDTFLQHFGVRPDTRWALEGDAPARLARMVEAAEREVAGLRPDLVLVLGDTNTVPLFSLAARRHGVPVAHLEAGLRSRNDRSIEEVNRKVAAACASLHLAPTEMAAAFLAAEGIPARRIRVVGNPVVDVLRRSGARRRPPGERRGVTLTAHRPTNVDRVEGLGKVVDLVVRLATALPPVTFPVHPRTRARLVEHGLAGHLEVDGVRLLAPLPYDEMLAAIAGSSVVVTDSGGLQEEASYFGVPVVVLRRSTPRWEGVALGGSALVGLDVDAALAAAMRFATPDEQARVYDLACPYGDGRTAELVADLLSEEATWDLLRLEEPDLSGWSGGMPLPGPR